MSSLGRYWKKLTNWANCAFLLKKKKGGGGECRGERGEWFLILPLPLESPLLTFEMLIIAWLPHIRSLQVLSPVLFVNVLRKKFVSLSFRQDSQKENKPKNINKKKALQLVLRRVQGNDCQSGAVGPSVTRRLVCFPSRNRLLPFLCVSIPVMILLKGARKDPQTNWKWNLFVSEHTEMNIKWTLFISSTSEDSNWLKLGIKDCVSKWLPRKRRVQANF